MRQSSPSLRHRSSAKKSVRFNDTPQVYQGKAVQNVRNQMQSSQPTPIIGAAAHELSFNQRSSSPLRKTSPSRRSPERASYSSPQYRPAMVSDSPQVRVTDLNDKYKDFSQEVSFRRSLGKNVVTNKLL